MTWFPLEVVQDLRGQGATQGAQSLHVLALLALMTALVAFVAWAARAKEGNLPRDGPRPSLPRRGRVAAAVAPGSSRMVLFDFDGVLTTQEVTGDLSQAARCRAFGGPGRLAELEVRLEELCQHARVGIVSRNYKTVIERALGPRPDLAQFFDPTLIFGYEDCDDSMPKSSVIEAVLQENDLHRHELLFVDDSFLNISDVSQHCHVETLHIRKSGMASWDWEYILGWAREPRQC